MLSPKGADRSEAKISPEGHFSPFNDSPLPEDDVPF